MKAFLPTTLLIACSAPTYPIDSEDAQTPSQDHNSSSNVSEAEDTTTAIRSSLCFTIDPYLEDIVWTIRDTASKTVERWKDWTIEFDQPTDCDSILTLGDVRNKNGGHAGAKHETPGGVRAAYVGGISIITINQDYLENLTIVDTIPAGCWAARPSVHYLLSGILTHEFGHVLNAQDSDDRNSVMFRSLQQCFDAFPTDTEIAASIRPAGTTSP